MGKNHKAHFRGDIQVDGSILGPDGEPVSEGGSVDVSALLPVDGSRSMTAPIHFAGGEYGEAFGPNLGWDEDNFGLLLSPQPGHSLYDNFVDLYLVVSGDVAYGAIDISVAEHSAPYIDMEYNPLPSGINYSTNFSSAGIYGYSDNATWQFGSGNVGQAQASLLNAGDRDFLNLKQNIDNDYRLKISADGALHWGGGAAAPDVSLERDGTGVFNNPGVGDLRIPGPHALIIGDLDSDYSLAGAYYSNNAIYMQDSDDSHWTNIGLGSAGFVSPNSAIILGNGQAQISNDTHIAVVNADGLALGLGGTIDVALVRHSPAFVQITTSGGGYVAHSPDGTAYKLTPPNGGGAATWVAA